MMSEGNRHDDCHHQPQTISLSKLQKKTTQAAVDVDDSKLAHAKVLGADLTFIPKTSDPAAELKKLAGVGVHDVLITAPSPPAFREGVAMTRKLGTCALVGLPPGDFPVSLFDVVNNCTTVRGSFVGTRKDIAEAMNFTVLAKLKAAIEVKLLNEINTIFARLQHGDVAARILIEYK